MKYTIALSGSIAAATIVVVSVCGNNGQVTCREITAPRGDQVAVDTTKGYGAVQQLNSLMQAGETPTDTLDRLLKNTHRVAIKFSAHWCGPCQGIAPEYAAQAKKHPDTLFIEVDVDQFSAVANKQGVRSLPTFCTYKNGVQQARWSGSDKKELRSQISKLIS